MARVVHGVEILRGHEADYILPYLENCSQEELETQN